MIGTIGFVVDTVVLYFMLYNLDAGYYLGRLVSYIFAASTTWFLNHHYTFQTNSDVNKHKQWLIFLVTNSFGGVINYGVYAVLITLYATFKEYPVLAVGIGSLSGLIINFILSKRIVFRA